MKTQDLIKLKENKTSLPIADVFKKRFSPRVFSDEKVKEEDLKIILEAARWTPSSYNRQPWFFYIAYQKSDFFNKLASLLSSGNEWAKRVPLLILACYIKKDQMGENDKAEYDLGQAVSTIVYQAQILGYYSHQIGGFDTEKAKSLVNPNHIPFVLIAIGKIGDYENRNESWINWDLNPPQRKDHWYEIKK